MEYGGMLYTQRNTCLILTTGVTYHDYCFSCTKCKRSVGDEKFCTHEGRIYCQQDYDSLFGVKCVGKHSLATTKVMLMWV